jgi:hypothetical protein
MCLNFAYSITSVENNSKLEISIYIVYLFQAKPDG